MARTTKIPCEGVIYTVHQDVYGTTIKTDEAAVVPPSDGNEAVDERARYAQVLAELDELEDALTQAEEHAARVGLLDDHETDEDSFPPL